MDLRERLANRIQLTTDGHVAYRGAVERVFGTDVDYAQLIKEYGVEHSQDASPTARRYSPNKVTGQEVRIVTGEPNPDYISTSYVERNNLTMRRTTRRWLACTSSTTTSPAFTDRSRRTQRPRWRLAWPITSGPFRKSQRCWTRPTSHLRAMPRPSHAY